MNGAARSDPRRLVLAARLRTLRLSLIAVRDSLGDVEESRVAVRELLPTINRDVYAKLDDIEAAATRVKKKFDLTSEREFVKTEVQAIAALAEEIRDYLTRVGEGLRVVGRVQQATQTALEQDFLSALDSQIETTRLLLEKLADDAALTPAAIQDAWVKQRQLYADSEEFFASYVEMLNGLALRDSGLDNGIPAIADALIQNRIAGWYSLTIAGHKRHDYGTRAKFIHLGFPEWTPWALPLAAFDFGRMEVRRKDTEFDSWLSEKEREGYDREEVETCLADAIATYLVGPAYVWATMVIQLDPASGSVARRIGMQRVQCMVLVLRKLDDPARPAEPVFGKVADDLAAAWKAASGEVSDEIAGQGDQPAPGQPAADQPAVDQPAAGQPAPGQPAPAARKDIDVGEFETWLGIRGFAGFRARAMKPDDWMAVIDLAESLRSGAAIETNDLSAVLNAAWLVRVEDQLDRSGDDSPLETLRERVTTVLSEIVRRLATGDEAFGQTPGRVPQAVARQ